MSPIARNHYEVLGVARDATTEDIHRAYRRLARRYHPDVNRGIDAGARFHEVTDAYEVLHDPERRARYDGSRARVSDSRDLRAPAFVARRPRRDVPRFLDDLDAPRPPQRGFRLVLGGWLDIRWWM